MPLTRIFRKTLRARVSRDIKFRQALLADANRALLYSDLEEGCAALRSCVGAAIDLDLA